MVNAIPATAVGKAKLLPDRHYMLQKTPMGEMSQGVDGETGWVKGMGQLRDDPRAAAKMKEEYERSLFHLLGRPEKLQVQALPEPRTIDGTTYSAAHVTSDLIRDWILYFDAQGRLAGLEYSGEGPQGPGKVMEMYGDWRPVGAIQYPHATKMLLDGTPMMEAIVVEAKGQPCRSTSSRSLPTLDAPATRIGSNRNLAKFLGWSANGKTFEN